MWRLCLSKLCKEDDSASELKGAEFRKESFSRIKRKHPSSTIQRVKSWGCSVMKELCRKRQISVDRDWRKQWRRNCSRSRRRISQMVWFHSVKFKVSRKMRDFYLRIILLNVSWFVHHADGSPGSYSERFLDREQTIWKPAMTQRNKGKAAEGSQRSVTEEAAVTPVVKGRTRKRFSE